MGLIEKLPYFYDNDIVKPIIEAEQIERDILFEEISDTLAQCFVSTATWGLDYWEEMLLIPHDSQKTIEERRTIIYAKMRGIRMTTVEVIRELAMSFFGVENVTVTEYNSEYYFNINFENTHPQQLQESDLTIVGKSVVGYTAARTRMVPVRLSDIEGVIDIYKPAHLNYSLMFTTKKRIRINTERDARVCTLPICGVYTCTQKTNAVVDTAIVGIAAVLGGE